MLLLTAVQSTQPDYVALAMVLVLAVIVAVMAVRKYLYLKRKNAQPVPTPSPAEITESAVAPGTAGQLKLHNVDPRTAAMLMAIVADKLNKPLNELRFISIKEVE